MALFKCKICGGSLEIKSGDTVATCEYCGTKQTLPKLDDARKINLYDRANHFRRNNEYDKAMSTYEQILNEDSTDAESYWSLVLCRYGIEYVEDPTTHKHVPTVNRAQFTSIYADENYKSALQYADGYQRDIYESEAKAIDEIQFGILDISSKEEPFDVFICYKETDKGGRRTPDSVIATELYHELTNEGFKVFFSRITLEDKLGTAYEPYIFAALNSAKVMVVLGTKAEHFNSVWVKNEWNRFLSLIQNGAKKTLIPAYRDIDPYDLPEEFSHLQALDMSKLGFMQDLVRGIRKITDDGSPKSIPKDEEYQSRNGNVASLFKRVAMALEDREFDRADAFCEQILNQEPENGEAYCCKLLAELHLRSKTELSGYAVSFEENKNFKKALQFANQPLKKELTDALNAVFERIEQKKKEDAYQKASALIRNTADISKFQQAYQLFRSSAGYRDADQQAEACQLKIQELQRKAEQIRQEKEIRQIARKAAAVKLGKRLAFTVVCLLIISVVCSIGYLLIFRIVIPNNQYHDAVALIDSGEYDAALELLIESEENALLRKTDTKIKKAIETAQSAKALEQAAAQAAKALEQAAGDAAVFVENADYQKAVQRLLNAGIPVEITYQPEGGILLDGAHELNSVRFNYPTNDSFSDIYSAGKTGYRFVGWTCSQYQYQAKEQTFSMVLTAGWNEKEYIIQYHLNGGSAENVTAYGVEDDDIALQNPVRTGYTFVGWTGTDLEQPYADVTVPAGSHGDRTYTANWKANQYSVQFDIAGGSATVTSAAYVYDSSFTLPTPQRTAYTFVGWYLGTQQVQNGTWKIASEVTLTAKWTPVTYQITYSGGKVPATNSNVTKFTVESNTIALKDLSYSNCTFEGWYRDPDFTDKVTQIPKGTSGNITLYAKWNIHTFTIEYDWDGGTVIGSAVTTYTIFDLPIYLPNSSKEGHSLYYWAEEDIDGKPIMEISTCANYKLCANYIPDGMTIQILYSLDSWCDASYSGSATEIRVPKYHKINTYQKSPYVQRIRLTSASNLQKIEFSDEIESVEGVYASEQLQFNYYENGAYLGSKNNPYLALVQKQNPDKPVLTIHEKTRYIGSGVFNGSMDLHSIVIPRDLKIINGNAFRDCLRLVEVYNLSDLNISNNYDHGHVGRYAKVIRTSLDEPSSLVEMGHYVFCIDPSQNLYELIAYTGTETELTLPDSVFGHTYTIGSFVFYGRSTLNKIVIPESVTGIGQSAFQSCDGLTEVVLPSKVTYIGENAFYGCTNLRNLILSESLTTIGNSAFYDCISLLSLKIPASLTDIGQYVFTGCNNLLEIYNLSPIDLLKATEHLSLHVKVIHTSLDEPSHFVREGDYLFYVDDEKGIYLLCAYLGIQTELYLPESIHGHKYDLHRLFFGNASEITVVHISNGVGKILYYAFFGMPGLQTVYIGKNVVDIDDYAFSDTQNLTKAFFAVPDGWYRTASNGGEITPEIQYDRAEIADPSNAAKLLKKMNSYYNHTSFLRK